MVGGLKDQLIMSVLQFIRGLHLFIESELVEFLENRSVMWFFLSEPRWCRAVCFTDFQQIQLGLMGNTADLSQTDFLPLQEWDSFIFQSNFENTVYHLVWKCTMKYITNCYFTILGNPARTNDTLLGYQNITWPRINGDEFSFTLIFLVMHRKRLSCLADAQIW